MKKIFIILVCTFIGVISSNAQHYWVNGPGDWYDIQHWSDTSGGEAGFGLPTVNDEVIFDENSTNSKASIDIAIAGLASCKSINKLCVNELVFNEGFIQTQTIFNNDIVFNSQLILPNLNKGLGDPITFVVETKDPTCVGDCDAWAKVTNLTGADPVVTYQWYATPGGFVSDQDSIGGLCDKTYFVIITDGDGDLEALEFYINAPAEMVVNMADTTNVTCFGDCDGKARVQLILGGVQPKTHSWSDGYTINGFNKNLCPGIYTDTIRDANGCKITHEFVINEPDELLVNDSSYTAYICDGSGGGSIHLDVTGGNQPPDLNYSIGGIYPDNNDGDFSLLAPGSYTVTVTDDLNCTLTSGPYLLEANSAVLPTQTHEDITCYGDDDGSVDVSVTGGVEPYTYNWAGPNVNGNTNQDLSLLEPGTYNLTVTDAALCTGELSVVIEEPDTLTINFELTNIQCNGDASGQVIAHVLGGTTAYDIPYQWSSGTVFQDSIIQNLPIGNYAVTVTDANGCKIIDNVDVNEPEALTLTFEVEDVSCNGDATGQVTAHVLGGTVAYNIPYLWSGGTVFHDSIIQNLPIGNYAVTVTDANGCEIIDNVDVNEPEALILNFEVEDVSCNGDATGQVTAHVLGGTVVYNVPYLWSSGTVFQDSIIQNLPVGNYAVTVTDANGCKIIDNVDVDGPEALSLSFEVSNVNCNGGSDGQITAHVLGGTTAYDIPYQWSSGTVFHDSIIQNLTIGNYAVTVTDANGCKIINNVDVTEPAALTISLEPIFVQCSGGSDGQVIAHVFGGAIPYGTPYNWSAGTVLNDSTIHNLPVGNYAVSVTDANGCLITDDVDITVPNPLNISFDVTNVQCNGGSDGQVVAHVTGGSPAYLPYSWSAGTVLNDSTIHNLAFGTYEVTVIDAHGCQIIKNVHVIEPNALSLTLEATLIQCNGGSDGQVVAHVLGGTTAYNTPYSWSSGTVLNDSTIHNLMVGNYVVTVTDANGCQTSDNIDVNEPAALSLSLEPKHVSCNGGSDGQIIAHVLGGTTSYNMPYSWSSGTVLNDTTIHNLQIGNYEVTVTDANGCLIFDNIDIIEPSALSLSLEVSPVSCNNGSDGEIIAHVLGGTIGYVTPYVWSSGTILNDSTIHHLPSGNYEVIVTDANNCQIIENVELLNPDPLNITFEASDVSCNGGSDGQVTAHVSGGTPIYDTPYLWSSGTVFNDSIIQNVSIGNYSVTVTDAKGCQIIDNIDVNEPKALSLSLEVSDVNCNGGSDGEVTAHILGGATPYIIPYLWSSGTVTNDSIIQDLTIGNYEVTVTDANGCQITDNVDVNEPNALSLSLEVSDVSCNGGSDGEVTAHVLGGTPAYNTPYLWSSGTVTNDSIIQDLTIGNYAVTVTDANGCQIIDNVDVIEPNALTLTLEVSDVNCNGGSDGQVTAHVLGGTPAYNTPYLWSSGTVFQDSIIQDLTIGNYAVTVTDANGCQIIDNVDVNEPNALSLSLDVSHVSCNGGSDGEVTAHVLGGTMPYIIPYLWSSGTVTNDSIIEDLTIGNYAVTVTDANACRVNDNVDVNEPEALTINLEVSHVSCNGDANGEIIAHVLGGTTDYENPYIWSSGTVVNDSIIQDLTIGNYGVTVTDANNCLIIDDVDVTEPLPLSITLVPSHVNCFGGEDGQIVANVTGGTEPYQNYHWSTGIDLSINTITDLPAGDYSVTVTDANGCEIISEISTIEDGESLFVNFSNISQVFCPAFCQDTANAIAGGGSGDYSYVWATTETGPNANELCKGYNTITITDNISFCQLTDSVLVLDLSYLEVQIDTVMSPACYGYSNGEIQITVHEGFGPYTYIWEGPDAYTNNIEDLDGLQAGVYYLTVSYGTGDCDYTAVFDLQQPDPITAPIHVIENISCNGDCDAVLEVNPIGGTGPYTIWWNEDVDESPSIISDLCPGLVSVRIEDAQGCTFLGDTTIFPPQVLSSDLNTLDTLTCFGDCDARLEVVPHGGTAPYTYLWSNDNTQNIIEELCIGTYEVTVTDSEGCVDFKDIELFQPTELTLSNISTSAVLCGEDDCTGTSIMEASGGTGNTDNYTFDWSSGQSGINLIEINTLCVGYYTVTVYDEASCEATSIFEIEDVSDLVITSIASTNILCYDSCNGSYEVYATGGTEPYNFVWSNGDVGVEADSLCDQVYYVTVTDANDCVDAETVHLIQPEEINISFDVTGILCHDGETGQIIASVTGGTVLDEYSYLWDDDATEPTEINIIQNLSDGIYTVTVSDDNGCFAIKEETLDEPTAIQITLEYAIMNLCYGESLGEIMVSATGGTVIDAYAYIWDDDVSDPTQDATVQNLANGTYTVTVSDDNECTANLPVSITSSQEIEISVIEKQDVFCQGESTGFISTDVIGGDGTYTFTWSHDDDLTLALADELWGGDYSLMVTDGNNCTDTIFMSILDTSNLMVQLSDSSLITCHGLCDATYTLDGNGGVLPYNYELFDLTGQQQELQVGNDSMFINLCSETYIARITDGLNCSATLNVIVNQPDTILIDFEISDVKCFGDTTGEVIAGVEGGLEPYTIAWTQNEDTLSSILNYQDLVAGIYYFNLRDSLNCIVLDSIEVGEPAALESSITISDTSYCRTDANTSLDLTPTGGTVPYTFLWSNDSTTEDLSQLIAGTYEVTITDENLCEQFDAASVIPKIAFDFGLSNDTIMCPNDTMQIFAIANSPRWNTNFYHWLSSDFISDSLVQNPLVYPEVSTHFYLALDSICKDTMAVYVEIHDTVGVDAGPDETILKDQTVQLEASYHDSIVSYLWSPSIGLSYDDIYDPVAGPKETQLYLLQVKTVKGCFEYDTLIVNVIPELVFPTGFTPNEDGINDNWEIDYIYKYPNVDVEIYNRWGEKLFHSKGYPDGERWDGIYNGQKLPVGTYYFIVRLNDGIHDKPITGPITIVR